MQTQPKKILIVDDEPGLTRMLKFNLEKRGEYEVMEVNAALHAWKEAKAFRPDLILLDVMMPGVDGGTLAAQLQSDPDLKTVPIVFLTAAVKKSEVLARNGVIGGLPFLAKPVELSELNSCLERHLGH